jgi:hypothetical protein
VSSLSAVLSVIGLIGLGSILGWAARVRELTRAQRLLHLSRNEAMDVIITTSSLSDTAQTGHYTDDRLHSQLGYLRATTLLGQLIARTGARKPLRVHVSDDVTIGSLESDMTILGGTGGNHVAAAFLERLRVETGTVVIYDESDESRNLIQVGEVHVEYDWIAEARSKRAGHDYGLIVLWRNPFTTRRRRALYVAAFTPAGTLAASRFFVDRRSDLRREVTRRSTMRQRLSQARRPSFAALVKIEFLDTDASSTASMVAACPLPPSRP